MSAKLINGVDVELQVKRVLQGLYVRYDILKERGDLYEYSGMAPCGELSSKNVWPHYAFSVRMTYYNNFSLTRVMHVGGELTPYWTDNTQEFCDSESMDLLGFWDSTVDLRNVETATSVVRGEYKLKPGDDGFTDALIYTMRKDKLLDGRFVVFDGLRWRVDITGSLTTDRIRDLIRRCLTP